MIQELTVVWAQVGQILQELLRFRILRIVYRMEPLGERLSLLEAQYRVAGMVVAVLAIILCFTAAWRFEDWGQTLGAWWGSLV